MTGRTPPSPAAVLALLLVCGCSHDWDPYAPAGGASSGPGASTSVGTGGHGAGTGGSASSSTGGVGSGAASTGGGTTGGGGGTLPTDCGGFDILGDDFEDGLPSGAWSAPTVAGGGTVTEKEGALVVALPSAVAGVTKGYLTSKRRHDLRDDRLSIAVPKMVNTATTASAGFAVVLDNDNYVKIYQKQGTMRFTRRAAAVSLELASVLYVPAEHIHWRFREEAGTLYWETSNDGSSFVVQAEAPTSSLFSFEAVRVELSGTTVGGEVSPGEVRFDDLNGGDAPLGKWCPVSSFSDDFGDGVQGPEWARSYASSGTKAEVGGELVLTPPSTVTGSAVYMTGAAYDLTGDAVVVEVPTMVDTTTPAQAYLRVENDADHGLSIAQQSGTIAFRYEEDGVTIVAASLLYVADDHRWWKIREAGGTVYWETSPDGAAWVVRAQMIDPPVDVTTLDVMLGAATYEVVAAPGAAHFDHYNAP
jgi:hypothetical protein